MPPVTRRDFIAAPGAAPATELSPATCVCNATKIKTSFTTGTLVAGQQYWFRVRALRPAGPSPWSDPATRVAGL